MNSITEQEIDVLARYIFSVSGIHLDRSKGYLLETRLKPLLAENNCKNYNDLYRKAVGGDDDTLRKDIIDAITTNETFFFRDNTPFDLLRNKIIPDLIDRRSLQYQAKIPIRIWSAACSTGQEVYSIAITLVEMQLDPQRFDISILGTDISSRAVGRASYGKYDMFEIERGLPPAFRNKYFTPMGKEWRIRDEVRLLAQFKKINLLGQFSGLGRFDVVFCRNVAIYFDMPNKTKLFRKIADILQPDGVLIVGGSESLTGLTTDFEVQRYLRGNYYTLKGGERPAVAAVKPANHLPLPTLPPSPPRPGPPVFTMKKKPVAAVPDKTPPPVEPKENRATPQPAPAVSPAKPSEAKAAQTEPHPSAAATEQYIPPRPPPASSAASLNHALRHKTQAGQRASLLEELGAKKQGAGLLDAAAGSDLDKKRKSLLETISQKQQERNGEPRPDTEESP